MTGILIACFLFIGIIVGIQFVQVGSIVDKSDKRNVGIFVAKLCDGSIHKLGLDFREADDDVIRKLKEFMSGFSTHVTEQTICPLFTPAPETYYPTRTEIVGGFFGLRMRASGEFELMKQNELGDWDVVESGQELGRLYGFVAQEFTRLGRDVLKMSREVSGEGIRE